MNSSTGNLVKIYGTVTRISRHSLQCRTLQSICPIGACIPIGKLVHLLHRWTTYLHWFGYLEFQYILMRLQGGLNVIITIRSAPYTRQRVVVSRNMQSKKTVSPTILSWVITLPPPQYSDQGWSPIHARVLDQLDFFLNIYHCFTIFKITVITFVVLHTTTKIKICFRVIWEKICMIFLHML